MAEFLTVWTLGIAVLAVVAPALGTLHVVLTKRNPHAALAWVGVLWLAPLLGAVAYLLIGVNRTRRRARALRRVGGAREVAAGLAAYPEEVLARALGPDREHLMALARLGDRVVGRPLLAGNRIRLLENGDEAFPEMLDAIAGARSSVTLLTYIFDQDPVGRRFREARSGARDRGVEIRVLVDAVGARYSVPPMTRSLRNEGITTAVFHPVRLPWPSPYLNLRNHRKILVVDGRVGFTGGMNIREGHVLGNDPTHPVKDLQFRLDGPVVAELQEVFTEDWLAATGEPLQGPDWFPSIPPVGDVVARGISDGPDIDFEKLQSMLLGALAAARERVRVMTPYFIPDERLKDALTIAAMRGVEVQILLPERGNLPLVQWASQAYRPLLQAKDVRIFLTPPPFDHSKLMVVDGGWALFGSANWDARSLQLNFEFNVECYDTGFAGELDRFMELRLKEAREVTLEETLNRPLAYRIRDGVARLASPLL
jgi:cardiolipin synthase A/B